MGTFANGNRNEKSKPHLSFKDRVRIFSIKHQEEIDLAIAGVLIGVDAFCIGVLFGKTKFYDRGYSVGYAVGEREGLRTAIDLADKITRRSVMK